MSLTFCIFFTQTMTWNGIILATNVNDLFKVMAGAAQMSKDQKIGLLLLDKAAVFYYIYCRAEQREGVELLIQLLSCSSLIFTFNI